MGRLFRQPKISHLMSSPTPSPPQKKGGERAGNLIQKIIVDPATRRGKEKLVYRLIVNSSPPRKSLVEGERFVRDEGDPELLRVV